MTFASKAYFVVILCQTHEFADELSMENLDEHC